MAKSPKPFIFKAWFIAVLRRASYKFPSRYNTFNAARVARGKYKCAKCEGTFGRKEVNVDHINPVIDPEVGFVDWNQYIERMFPAEGGYQVLCTGCHDIKTQAENAHRREIKALSKNKPSKD